MNISGRAKDAMDSRVFSHELDEIGTNLTLSTSGVAITTNSLMVAEYGTTAYPSKSLVRFELVVPINL